MAKVLITGMSGTGKSATLEILRLRGHHTVDTDTDEWSVWVRQNDGSPDWIWREEVIAALLDQNEDGQLFVAGCKTNQGKFYSK
jgi:predicted ATPase